MVALGGAWLATRINGFGFFFLGGIPITIGYMIGYYGNIKWLWQPLAVAVVLVSALGVALFQGLAGLVCGGMALVLVAVPTMGGAFIGHQMRSRYNGRIAKSLGAMLVLLMPLGLWAEAALTPRHAPESVTTSRILDMDAREAWTAAAFYEDVALEPPTLLRVGLPTPIGTTGRQDEVGAIVECLYENASITKRMTEVVPGKVLAFEVLQQSGIEDRSAALRSGSFVFDELVGGRTRVTLQTTYEPLLDARCLWRPFERLVCRELHEHILDGMEAQVPKREGGTAHASTVSSALSLTVER